jgi:hypothetical protein
VKFNRALAMAAFAVPLLSVGLQGAGSSATQMVDSGSFGVFMQGQRVATEKFSIEQNPNGSVVISEFKSDQGAQKAEQSSELQLTANGELRRYEWKEASPGKTQAVVIPSQDMLTERITSGSDKPQEKPFYLPTSSSILDDYFFVQREVLLWRYLATACRQEAGALKCPQGQKTQFGTLNPHARNSSPVEMAFGAVEKVRIHGAERELSKFTLTSDSGDWSIWVDDHFKVIRILIASDSTEVVRD